MCSLYLSFKGFKLPWSFPTHNPYSISLSPSLSLSLSLCLYLSLCLSLQFSAGTLCVSLSITPWFPPNSTLWYQFLLLFGHLCPYEWGLDIFSMASTVSYADLWLVLRLSSLHVLRCVLIHACPVELVFRVDLLDVSLSRCILNMRDLGK